MQQMVFKKAWMTRESATSIRVLRHCFVQLSDAIFNLNSTFDKFWLMDTLQLTVTTVSTLGRIALSEEKLNVKNLPAYIMATITISRLLLLSIFCGDVSDEVNS